jgi:hypothetical protein
MPMITNEEMVSRSLQLGFEARLRELLDEQIAKAKADLETAMRREVGSIALSMMKHFSMERYGDDLRIIIKDMRDK